MLELLAAIERLPLVDALKTSFYVYPLVNALHILAIGLTVAAILLMDLRMLGGLRQVPAEPFAGAMRSVIAIVFPVAVLSGLALFSIAARDYAANPAFLAKMGLLVVAGMNLLAFRRLARGVRLDERPPSGTMKLAAALSIALWVAILVAGRFIGFV